MSTHTEAAKVGHTPGPWTVRQIISNDNPDADGVFVSSLAPIYPANPDSPLIGTLAECFAVRSTRNISEVLANARLIAAAPELLAFARSYFAAVGEASRRGQVTIPQRVANALFVDANAAIAKAEGNA